MPTKVFTSPRRRWGRNLAIGGIFTALAVVIGATGDWIGWVAAAFFGLVTFVAAYTLKRPVRLEVSDEGLLVVIPPRAPDEIAWAECDNFRPWESPGLTTVKFDRVRPDGTRKGYLLPDSFGVPPDEMCTYLKERKHAAANRSGSAPQ
jgi:hypothetical protein